MDGPKPSSRRRATASPTGPVALMRWALISTGESSPSRRTQRILLFTSARGGEDKG